MLDVSIAYAVWSGVGTASVAAIGATTFGESLGRTQWLGIGLIRRSRGSWPCGAH
ncbi:DMT family transporter [Streptomyces violascens]|uniref:DMT family transporter n=1 Tax=Streptomyces violascens TaxID=67381 RepID=UPI0036BA46E8